MTAASRNSSVYPLYSKRQKLLLFTCLLVLASPAAWASVVTRDFNCGAKVCGSVKVTHDDRLTASGNPFQVVNGDDSTYTIFAGMEMSAVATPKTSNSTKWAWMQGIVDLTTPMTIRDPNRNMLDDPFPDTPPGGYIFDAFGPVGEATQIWDTAPWYGNNVIGQLSLWDFPNLPADTSVRFESWLVCVEEDVATPNAFDVIPLVGFNWGFDLTKGADGPDAGDVAGDSTSEYTGTTFMGALIQGGQPSDAFKAGYAKYFNIDYLANNDFNCGKLHCVPEPSSPLLILVGMLAIGFLSVGTRPKGSIRLCSIIDAMGKPI